MNTNHNQGEFDAPVQGMEPLQREPARKQPRSEKAVNRNTPKKRKSKKRAKRGMNPFLVFALLCMIIVLTTLIFLMMRSVIAARDFAEIYAQVQAKEDVTLPSFIEETQPPVIGDGLSQPESTQPEETKPRVILPKYADLYKENSDLFGWVRIDDTKINYPVMRSEDDPEKYLHANFKGEYSYPGIPFADLQCTRDSDNILIYAHNMLDGSMFRSLIKYENKSYWEKHPTIIYSDLCEDYEYEVVAAFYDRVYLKTETDVFKFYQFINAEDEADFNYAISQFKEKALYDTGVTAQYGDKLVTLVTCAYHETNGRFVVVARQK